MSLGFAFAFLLTLHSLQLVSTQTSNPLNGNVMPTVAGIPNSAKKESAEISPEEDVNSMTFSGDEENNGQHDNMNKTLSDQTTNKINDSLTINNEPSILQNSTSRPGKPNPHLETLTTVRSHVNHTETTSSTSPSPGNSTTATLPALNSTQNSTSYNLTTTSPPQDGNYTKSPSENSTHITTTSMNSNTTIIQLEKFRSTSAKISKTRVAIDPRGNVDGGLSSDTNEQETKHRAWGVILGIGVAVAILGTVIYMIVKRRNYRDFSHRKLIEDMPSGPVLRLDNSEPLDLKFDGFAYYNPGLQGDNIQMTNFPKGYTH